MFIWENNASTVTMQSKYAVVNVSFIQSVALKAFMAYSSLDCQCLRREKGKRKSTRQTFHANKNFGAVKLKTYGLNILPKYVNLFVEVSCISALES